MQVACTPGSGKLKGMFVHLHVHSHFSFFESPTPPAALAKKAAALGMAALALTDRGVLHGAPSFVAACQRHGLRPLVGAEILSRVEEQKRPAGSERRPTQRGGTTFGLVLLCRDAAGYRNLCRLSSAAQGAAWTPTGEPTGAGTHAALPLSLLAEQARGLVCLSGSGRGPLVQFLGRGERQQAAATARLLRDIFGEAFFIELPAAAPRAVLAELVDLARREGIPLVATADAHYAEPREAPLRRFLLAGRRPYDPPAGAGTVGGDLWLCSEREIRRRTAFLRRAVTEEALANTVAIAEECRWVLGPLGAAGGTRPPEPASLDGPARATSPQGEPNPASAGTSADRLRRLVEDGRRSRYPGAEPPEVASRLERELEVIIGRGLADYFLLAHRVASWCRQKGIPLGPGRGSAAGSLVCYCLGITDVDPTREGLIFERFLNPERPDLPDIDMDVCQRRRPEVISMLTEQAGAVGVVTFTTLGAKSALRLAGRALGLPTHLTATLAGTLPAERGPGALAHALATVPELRAIPRDREPFRTLFEVARSLEGIPVGRSRHPSGVVAIPPDRRQEVPLYRAPDGQPVSQYDAEALEMLGVPKLDVLGLRHLTVAGDTERMVRQLEPGFSLDRLDPGDPTTWHLIGGGETVGCFQLESEGMRNLLRRMRPISLPDLATAIASHKPGPLRARSPASAVPALLRDILAPTRGTLVYQEQVMEAGQRLAAMTPAEADLMRRVLEKGHRLPPALLREWETRFLTGARRCGIPEGEAKEAFRWLARAAGYTFNRAHATCYARLAYQAAFLKAHYPAPYLAALLSSPGGYYPPDLYIYEARRLGIAVLPAHPNHSGAFWRAEEWREGKGAIRAGLLSLPGVGLHGALGCLRERARGGDFRSPEDLADRLRGKVPAAALTALLAAWEEGGAAPGAGQEGKQQGGPGAERGREEDRPEARWGDAAEETAPAGEVVLTGRVVQGERIPAAGGGYRLVLLLDTGHEMVHVHVPPQVYARHALDLDPRRLTVRGRLQRRGGRWRLLARAISRGLGGES
ncbi:MAG: DNA polymerase III subunit alpha [Bacillota bacterium]|nr:DNA polymerase III subunit alpha [Bacillota bacterium]